MSAKDYYRSLREKMGGGPENPKEGQPNSPALAIADWWAGELARAQAAWDAVKDGPHTGAADVCALCWAGDGDPRCQRCGCSVGHPGCRCPEGYLAGPCVADFERATHVGHFSSRIEEP